MIDQLNFGVTKTSVEGALVPHNEYMFTGSGSMLPHTERLRSGSVEVPQARLLPYGMVPRVLLTSGLERLCIVSTSLPSILLAGTRTGGIAVVKLASPRANSPPWGVSKLEPSNIDDCADIISVGTEGLSIESLESCCSRIVLKLMEVLMHVLSVGESTVHGDSNRLSKKKSLPCLSWGVFLRSRLKTPLILEK